jgi:hypothetical protein
MTGKWIARRYEPGDEERIIQLRKLVFGDGEEQRNTQEYWRWEYRDCPAGQATIWVAEAGESIVGHYAVRPVRMQYCGEPILGSTSIDAMTHPDYRGQDVFATLGQAVYADLAREGPALTYIFPRKISMIGSIAKFDWEYLCALSVFVKPLRAARIVDRFVPGRAAIAPVRATLRLLLGLLTKPRPVVGEEEYSVRWLDRFDHRIDEFWSRVAPRHRIAVVRDSAYLNWRYFDNPAREYRAIVAQRAGEIVAYLVTRCMEQFGLRGGMIVDLGALPGGEGALALLLGHAEQFFREQGMDLTACLINGERRYVPLLRQQGSWPLPGRLGFKRWYFGYRLNSPKLSEAVCADRAHWFLTFGDTDVV